MDFFLRRSQFAPPDIWKMAMKQPVSQKSKKVKNQSTNLFGETIGRLHLEKQDIEKMGGKKSKALRRAEKIEKEEQRREIDADLAQERAEMGAEFKQIHGFGEDEME